MSLAACIETTGNNTTLLTSFLVIMGRLPPVREHDGRLLPAIVHRVSSQWVYTLRISSKDTILTGFQQSAAPQDDVFFANTTLVSTSQHYLDVRHDTTALDTVTITGGTCCRSYDTASRNASGPAGTHLQSEPSTGTWSPILSISFSDESLSINVPQQTTARLSGTLSTSDTTRQLEVEVGAAVNPGTGELEQYEEMWEMVPKMVMVPEEGQRAVGIVLKTVPGSGDASFEVKGMVMRVAHVLLGVLVIHCGDSTAQQQASIEQWMYDPEFGWGQELARSTDEVVAKVLTMALDRARMAIDTLEVGKLFEIGDVDGVKVMWKAEELSWSKTRAQLEALAKASGSGS
jgi:hypothetical protein